MRDCDFRDQIHSALRRSRSGKTWAALKSELKLPYDRPCPEWTKRLEQEIGLRRTPGTGRSLLWAVDKPRVRAQ
jgi:hypothetical protein